MLALFSWFVLLATAVSASVAAQCATQWVTGAGVPSVLPPRVYATTVWDPDGSGPGTPLLVVGGRFQIAGAVPATGLATFDPVTNTWAPIGTWGFGQGLAAAVMPNGDLVCAGWDDILLRSVVARWDGTSWNQLGGLFTHTLLNGDIDGLTCTPSGEVFACGVFDSVGGIPHSYIARWDGSAWSSPGGGMNNVVDCVVTMPNGDVVAGGLFTAAGGTPAPGIARWNGTSWATLGSGGGGNILALALAPNGDLLAAGIWTNPMRWNGSTWTLLPPIPNLYYVEGLAVLPNGDVIAGGQLGAVPDGILRCTGSSWSNLGGLTGWGGGRTFATLPDGDLVTGGWFNAAGTVSSPGLARLTTTCPATITSLGMGCAGGGNATASLPWIGANWSLQATGLPTSSFVIGVQGFATVNTPLGTLLPQGQAGCALLVRPDYIGWMANANGTATAQFAIPSNAALVGTVFHHQTIALTHNPALAISNVTASNALALTIGSF